MESSIQASIEAEEPQNHDQDGVYSLGDTSASLQTQEAPVNASNNSNNDNNSHSKEPPTGTVHQSPTSDGDETLSMPEESPPSETAAAAAVAAAAQRGRTTLKSLHDLAFYSSDEAENDAENHDASDNDDDDDSDAAEENNKEASDADDDDDDDDDADSDADDDRIDNDINTAKAAAENDKGASDDDDDDDDDSDEDEDSNYELQKVCMETNEVGVGSLIRVSWERTTGKKRKTKRTFQMWGEIIGQRSEEVFDVQSEGKVLRNVSIQDMHTLESPKMKDDILSLGDIVYAAWPGTDPKTEKCYWGKISGIKYHATAEGPKKLFSIIFFPDEGSYGLVDVTEDLASEFMYREPEAKYLMKDVGILGKSKLPSSSRMTLQQLVALREEQEKNPPSEAEVAKAANEDDDEEEDEQEEAPMERSKRKSPARSTATKRKAAASTKKKAPARTANTKRTASKPANKRQKVASPPPPPSNLGLQDPHTYQLEQGDLVFAPYPNCNPQKERWFWGTVSSLPRRQGADMVVDVQYADGLQSLGVKKENLYKLEAQDHKDAILQVNDKVYAPWPGKEPEKESYYWGRISGTSKRNGKSRYTIQFYDGDVTKNIESTHFHRYVECIHMMDKQMIAKDEPPANL